MIDINNQQDYFTYYLSTMRKTKTKSFNWLNVVRLMLPLAIFAGAIVWLGSLIS